MKKIMSLMFALALYISVGAGNVSAQTTDVQFEEPPQIVCIDVGAFEGFYHCIRACQGRTNPNTLLRTLCYLDCYTKALGGAAGQLGL